MVADIPLCSADDVLLLLLRKLTVPFTVESPCEEVCELENVVVVTIRRSSCIGIGFVCRQARVVREEGNLIISFALPSVGAKGIALSDRVRCKKREVHFGRFLTLQFRRI